MDLSQKIDLSRFAPRKDILTFVLIVLLTLLIGYNVIYRYQVNKINYIKFQIEEEKKKNELLDIISLMDKKLESYRQRSFSSREVTELVDQLSLLASQAGVTVETFNPKPPEVKEQHIEIPLTIPLRCNYHQLGELISLIESNQQLILIKKLNMQKATVAADRPATIPRIDLTLTGFYLKK